MPKETLKQDSGNGGPCRPQAAGHNHKELLEDIKDVSLLLNYASNANIDIPKTLLDPLIKAKNAAQEGPIKHELEVDFWEAYLGLAGKLYPISVKSLKATAYKSELPPNEEAVSRNPLIRHLVLKSNKRQSQASMTLRKYQRYCVATLSILLLLQIYTIVGLTTVNEIEGLENKFETELSNIEKSDSYLSSLNFSTQEYREFLEQINKSDLEIDKITDKLIARRALLVFWFPPFFDSTYMQTTENSDKSRQDQRLPKENYDLEKQQQRLQIAKITFEALSKYFLPLVYGFLGASVYVIRTLSREIQDRTFTMESRVQYQARLYLGGLAGLAIGWFITQDTAPSILESITPMALAFLAGYGVEILFSAMDTLIATFVRAGKSS